MSKSKKTKASGNKKMNRTINVDRKDIDVDFTREDN